MKKTNNKGFSLVELIIVIAIMAVLMTVLAPQFLKYVEKSRLQKDNSAIGEIEAAIKIALADEDIVNSIPTAGLSYPATATGFTFNASSTDLLEKELGSVIGTSVLFSSKEYKDRTTNYPTVIVADAGNGTYTVSHNYVKE